jgi:hypothetical protein
MDKFSYKTAFIPQEACCMTTNNKNILKSKRQHLSFYILIIDTHFKILLINLDISFLHIMEIESTVD